MKSTDFMVCIHQDKYDWPKILFGADITFGKHYECEPYGEPMTNSTVGFRLRNDLVKVKDDNGVSHVLPTEYFMSTVDYRIEKLNQIINGTTH